MMSRCSFTTRHKTTSSRGSFMIDTASLILRSRLHKEYLGGWSHSAIAQATKWEYHHHQEVFYRDEEIGAKIQNYKYLVVFTINFTHEFSLFAETKIWVNKSYVLIILSFFHPGDKKLELRGLMNSYLSVFWFWEGVTWKFQGDHFLKSRDW